VLAYANDLLQNPSLGSHLRALQFCGETGDFLFQRPAISRCSTHIFSQSTRLTRLCAMKVSGDYSRNIFSIKSFPISWENFGILANTAGPVLDTLEDVFIYGDAQQFLGPSIWGQFSILRSLECSMHVRFIFATGSISPHHLSSLVSLNLRFCDSSFLDVLSCMK
jgi:hypothetical protein